MTLKEKLSNLIKIEKINTKQINIVPEEKIVIEEERPFLKPLTQEEIDSIHKRGNITAEEKVKEWERKGTCAPGVSSDKSRCNKFNHNCHDCLIDYVSNKKEYKPLDKLIDTKGEDFGFNIYDQPEIKMTMKKKF